MPYWMVDTVDIMKVVSLFNQGDMDESIPCGPLILKDI